jgi:di/tripeptidase
VLLGPGGEGAHAKVEWVDVPSLERLRELVVAVATAWCG